MMDQTIDQLVVKATSWLQANLLTVTTAAQWACVVGALFVAMVLGRLSLPRLSRWVEETISVGAVRSMLLASIEIGYSLIFFGVAQICIGVFVLLDHFPHWLFATSDLALAWIIISILVLIIPNRFISRLAAGIVWCITLLHILGLLNPIITHLQGLSLSMGDSRISVYGVIKGLLMAAICLQVASLVSRLAVKRIETARDLSPTLRVLVTKIINIALYTAAIILAMSSVGIDLTSLTLFSSAVGVGIGFGLKTIFSNYVSGILLLMDNSIKPGDTIEIGGVLGTVRDMHGRYASLLTRDGKEYLVPNEQLIANEVVNWTHSDRVVRLTIPVTIPFKVDKRMAKSLLEEATVGVGRVLRSPSPVARMVALRDHGIKMELRIWIADAEAGVRNVTSDVLFNICDLFEEHGIEFPFPQQDLTVKPDSVLQVDVRNPSMQIPEDDS